MHFLTYVGLALSIGLIIWLAIGAVTFAQPSEHVLVVALWTDCISYDDREATNFVSAMHKIWPKIQIVYGCVDPDKILNTRFDYENWQHQLGISQYQTLFITTANNDLFSVGDYDGYTYPEMKIGFYKKELSHDTFLLSHEILHLALYELSNGDIMCWSLAVHEHYYNGSHPQSVPISVGNEWTKNYNILENFSC